MDSVSIPFTNKGSQFGVQYYFGEIIQYPQQRFGAEITNITVLDLITAHTPVRTVRQFYVFLHKSIHCGCSLESSHWDTTSSHKYH